MEKPGGLERLKIFAGSSCPELAERICNRIGISLSPTEIKSYSNGCFEVILNENIRGCKVFLIQTSIPDNQELHWQIWELLEMVNAAQKASAKEVNVVMLYISYARSDKKWTAHMPIAGKLFVNFLEAAGMHRFVGVDFHSPQFEGFFGPLTLVDRLSAQPLIVNFLREEDLSRAILLPGDDGASKKAKALSEKVKIFCGNVKKRRISDTKVVIDSIEGNVREKDVFVIDDEICGATTARELGKKLRELGAKTITFIATHGLFTGNAIENLQSIEILKRVVVTSTVPIRKEVKEKLPIKVIDIAPLLADVILEIYKEGSVSRFFN